MNWEQILSNALGSFIAGLILATILALAAYFAKLFTLPKKIEKMSGNIEHIEKEIKKLPAIMNMLVSIIDWLDETSDGKFLKKPSTSSAYNNLSSYIQSASPLSLNDRGKEIAKNLHAEEVVGKYKEKIFSELDKQNLTNALDIQQSSAYFARRKFFPILTEEDQEKIKNTAFIEGDSLYSILSIYGIIIRDKYLAYKGIDVKELDKK